MLYRILCKAVADAALGLSGFTSAANCMIMRYHEHVASNKLLKFMAAASSQLDARRRETRFALLRSPFDSASEGQQCSQHVVAMRAETMRATKGRAQHCNGCVRSQALWD